VAKGVERHLLATLLFAIAATATPARAQTPPPVEAPKPQAPPPSEAAAKADALFQEGKRLLEAGSFDPACALLAQSDALDPTVSALGLLAACHEQQGKLATAWREYQETARRAADAHDERGDFAKQRAAALAPRLPKIAVHVARGAPGLELRRDGELQPESAIGAEIAVDPGPHELTVTAPGRVEQRIRVVAKEGAVITADVPELAPIATAPIAPPPPPPETTAQRLGARLPAGIAVGTVGLVGLGIGIGFGVSALNQNLESKSIYNTCKAPGAPAGACDEGRTLRDGSFRAGTISTIGFGFAVAGIGVGAALLLWPRAKTPAAARAVEVTPIAGAQGGGALVGGRF
jgi:hypothetical protein